MTKGYNRTEERKTLEDREGLKRKDVWELVGF
jgi:hypothetical protein